VIVAYTQRRKLTVFYSMLIYDGTTFISRESVLNEKKRCSYVSKLVPIFYSAIKHWYRRFIS